MLSAPPFCRFTSLMTFHKIWISSSLVLIWSASSSKDWLSPLGTSLASSANVFTVSYWSSRSFTTSCCFIDWISNNCSSTNRVNFSTYCSLRCSRFVSLASNFDNVSACRVSFSAIAAFSRSTSISRHLSLASIDSAFLRSSASLLSSVCF